jgi:SagB-type dehydrogenase family enzyme
MRRNENSLEIKMLFKPERREVLIRLFNGCVAFLFVPILRFKQAFAKQNEDSRGGSVKLPSAQSDGEISVEQAIEQRRTVRAFKSTPLELEQLAQLLWAAQGITGKGGFKRSAPSAGALYPMDVYIVAGQDGVTQIDAGVYHYQPRGHALSTVAKGDLREALSRASLSQMWMAQAPVNMLITAEYDRAAVKYGKRAIRYAMIEAGHIGQNLFLQAEALGLKAGIVGAYHDNEVIRVLDIPRAHEPLLIMPIGHPLDIA